MKIKARGDFVEWFLLSPELTEREAQKMSGNLGMEIASESDRGLLLHKISKKEVKEAWVNYQKGFP